MSQILKKSVNHGEFLVRGIPKTPVEGILCGNGKPEKLIFFDSYRHYLNFRGEEGDYLVYDGYIDDNPFIFDFVNYKIKKGDKFIQEV